MLMLDCPDLAVPPEVMQHVVNVESARNPFAIGVVGGYLARQPTSLDEALAAVRQLKKEGYNFSVGIAQVNRYNLAKYGLPDYASAFQACPNLKAGSRILRECYDRAQDWGKAFSCYYSGNFVTGFDHGYVQKIFASIRKAQYVVQDVPKAVRIIPYNSKTPRKIARDDGLPVGEGKALLPSSDGNRQLPAVANAYPEPYAIRRYLPSTPLADAATALAQGRRGRRGLRRRWGDEEGAGDPVRRAAGSPVGHQRAGQAVRGQHGRRARRRRWRGRAPSPDSSLSGVCHSRCGARDHCG